MRLLEGAAAGEVRRVHPDGYDPDAVAARGVGRTASDLHADLARALAALEAAWDILDDDHWSRHGVMAAGAEWAAGRTEDATRLVDQLQTLLADLESEAEPETETLFAEVHKLTTRKAAHGGVR